METKIISNQKAIAFSAICLSTVLLTSAVSSLGFANSAFAQYGLGLPKSASSGGATRTFDQPSITLIAPRDGAKTLAVRPTFLLSVNPPAIPSSKPSDRKKIVTITFILRDGNEKESKPIFLAEGKADQFGLYKFTLPDNAPALVKGKVQRWQIRFNGATSNVYAQIRLDDDPIALKAIASSKNDLEKARIYTKNAYWYDAIDAYTSWLSQNPSDDLARSERSNLLQAGLKSHLDFAKRDDNNNPIEELDTAKLSDFLTKLDASKNATSLVLSKNRR